MADQQSSGSLADRITQPAASSVTTDKLATSNSKFSWADDTNSPSTPTQPSQPSQQEDAPAPKIDQLDGAGEDHQGSELVEAEYDVEIKLSDIQGDETSPLFSVTSFEQLGMSPEILKGIYSMNFQKPSKIQEKALPLLLRDPPRNMIAQSQSGTGKTAAFVLTILTRIDYTKPHQPQALCLAPSRELARQIQGVVQTIGQYVEGLTVAAAVPGANERGAKIQAMVVCGTPGTVMDLVKRRQMDPSQIKILCLDEADNMLDQQGLGDQCLRVKQLMSARPQILLFSATFPDRVIEYAQQFCPSANEIKLRHTELTVKGISQMYIEGPNSEAKYEILAQLYGLMTIGSSIIFVREKKTADRIARKLGEHGHKVVAIHGEYDGAQRDEILSEFRNGAAKVLITTNVLARGIDVQTVSMVINYDIPMIYDPAQRKDVAPDYETYLHRIGRTGRFGRVGVSITFVFNKYEFQALNMISQHYGIDLIKLDSGDWDVTEGVVKSIIKSSRAGQNMKNT